MFTGLIEEIGKIKSVRSIGGGRSMTVTARKDYA
jgi:riboflavin synthase alpha subunit